MPETRVTQCGCELTAIRLVGYAAHEDEHDTAAPACVVKSMEGAREYADTADSGIKFLVAEHRRLRELAEEAMASRADCFDHADNCCVEWCDRCRAGMAGRGKLQALRTFLEQSSSGSKG